MLPTVNILTERHPWILRRAALELEPLGCTINEPEGRADIDFYLPYLIGENKNSNIQIGYYTHREGAVNHDTTRKLEKWNRLLLFDWRVAMSQQAFSHLLAPGKQDLIIQLGSRFFTEITFGVCGKVHKSGRKNEGFVKYLMDKGYNFVAWGHGWPCEIVGNTDDTLLKFYERINYLVVTSSIEGGPVPVLEALSLGIPVIAPDVGWCWEYPVIRYEKNDMRDLEKVLAKLSRVRTWNDWRRDCELLFEKAMQCKE